jgi:integrase
VANGGEAGFHNHQDSRILDKASINPKGKLDKHSPLAQPPKQLSCPECGSTRLYKDGLRYLADGTTVQRWLCRNCGYRFSEQKPLQKISNCQINMPSALFSKRQVCELLTRASKNLAEVNARQETAQREGTEPSHLSALILDYAWQAKKRGLAEITIKQRVYKLKLLVKKGAHLTDPDSVLTVLATNNWTQANKRTFIIAYQSFAKTFEIKWQPPKTRVERKLPYIPTEEEISQLIAGCGKKTATFLQVLKDTAARTAEAVKIRWTDIDERSNIIRINNPVKGSLARIVKVTPNTIAMINNMPKTSEFIFDPNPDTTRKNFCKQRNRIARTLQNPRLKQIHLHTFRHWKATMEYHRTKNIKYVQQLLGHKKLENTDFYTQLLDFENDEWHVAHATNLEEENKLIEAGFEYVRYSEKDEVAIYRKRK